MFWTSWKTWVKVSLRQKSIFCKSSNHTLFSQAGGLPLIVRNTSARISMHTPSVSVMRFPAKHSPWTPVVGTSPNSPQLNRKGTPMKVPQIPRDWKGILEEAPLHHCPVFRLFPKQLFLSAIKKIQDIGLDQPSAQYCEVNSYVILKDLFFKS